MEGCCRDRSPRPSSRFDASSGRRSGRASTVPPTPASRGRAPSSSRATGPVGTGPATRCGSCTPTSPCSSVGSAALLLQSLHPLAMAGVAEHSDYRTDPWGRLQRTAQFLAYTTYGTVAQAEAALRHGSPRPRAGARRRP